MLRRFERHAPPRVILQLSVVHHRPRRPSGDLAQPGRRDLALAVQGPGGTLQHGQRGARVPGRHVERREFERHEQGAVHAGLAREA